MIQAGRWPLVSAKRMRTLDRHTIEKWGVPGDLLMENAGRAVVDALLRRFGAHLAAPQAEVCVVCGAGNNAGDGFVVARHLVLLGHRVRVALLTEPSRLRGDAAAHFERLGALGLRVEGADWEPPERGVLVDAVFGTGLSRPVEGVFGASIERINRAGVGLAVVAVDLPSGLDADTGAVRGCAVRADLTIAISLPKIGLTLEPGRGCAGEIQVARVGIADALPDESIAEAQSVLLWSPRAAAGHLPERPRAGHKGSFGHVLVAAGSEGKTGAAALAALGAGRVGAGLVTLACPSGLNDVLEVKCTEAMTAPLAQTSERTFALAALPEFRSLASERDVVVLGPGIGRRPETLELARAAALEIDRPLVLDADGLFAFRGCVEKLARATELRVLTPHPGEAAGLLGRPAGEINRDRVAAARELAAASRAVVLLKGAASVIASPDARVIVNPTGGPALATGGTGDVLAGAVAGLLAQGLGAFEAAALAAYLHGAAGDRWCAAHGSAGLLATELADGLPAAAEALRLLARDDVSQGEGGSATLLSFPGA